ncbi:MAG: tetratricopeptide repeat protein, partial [Planctomycetota bacterium]
DHVRRAIEIVGPTDSLVGNVITLMTLQQKYDQAMGYTARMLAEHPDLHVIREQYISQLVNQQRIDEAFAVAEDGLRHDADNVSNIARLGQLEANFRDINRAVELLRRGVELEPDNVTARVLLSQALVRFGDLDASEVQISAAMELVPDDAKPAVIMDYCRALYSFGHNQRGDQWQQRAQDIVNTLQPPATE